MLNGTIRLLLIIGLLSVPVISWAGDGKLLEVKSIDRGQYDPDDRRIIQSGFNSMPSDRNLLKRDRENPWSLPKVTGTDAAVDTLRLLGLRFNSSPPNRLLGPQKA